MHAATKKACALACKHGMSKIIHTMALTEQDFRQVLTHLHSVFPEDLHIARLLIHELQRAGSLEEARNKALDTARRMVSLGKASSAAGFLEICRQLEHEDVDEIEALSSLARFTGDGGVGLEPDEDKTFLLLEQLSDQEVTDFLRQGRLSSVEKGVEVVHQGDVENTFHLILEGSTCVSMETATGHNIQLGSLEAGRFFGEVACVYNLPRSASVTTTEPCLILEFTSLAISQLMQRSPLAGESLMRIIQARMISAMSHSHPALEALPENDRQWLAEESLLLEFKDKDVIVRQSEMGNNWYILVHGDANTRMLRVNGEVTTVPLKSGAIFGGLIPDIGLPPRTEVTAIGRCLVCHAPKEVFQSFISVYDAFERWVKSQGEQRLNLWKHAVSEKSTKPAK